MFAVGVFLVSLGYAAAYYGATVLSWAHSSKDGQNLQPPSLGFVLGVPGAKIKPFIAPINVEGATGDQKALFGGPGMQQPQMGDQLAQKFTDDPQLTARLRQQFPNATPQQLEQIRQQLVQQARTIGNNTQQQLQKGDVVGPLLGRLLPNPFSSN